MWHLCRDRLFRSSALLRTWAPWSVQRDSGGFKSKRALTTTLPGVLALPPPSAEQELVIEAIRNGQNARVIAVAGSGKTTTILQVAKAFPNLKILGCGLLFWMLIDSTAVQPPVEGGYAETAEGLEHHEQFTGG